MLFPKDPKPARSTKYLEFIRAQPCAVYGGRRGVEAAHTGPHGLGAKASDTSAIPLCAEDHRTGPRSYHRLGPAAFEAVNSVSIQEVVALYNRQFLGITRKSAWIS